MYVIVVGCGRVGSQLATSLSEDGHDVVVIDKTADAFRRLGDEFNGITIEGIGFDQRVLEEAGVDKADALAAVTEFDNTNLMTAEVATKLFGIKKAIARLYNPTRELTYQKLGVEYVCGTTMLAERVQQEILAPSLHVIATLHNLFIVKVVAGEQMAGCAIGSLDKEGEYRIVTVIRGKRNILCKPDTTVRKNDELVIVCHKENLASVENMAGRAD